MATSSHRNIGYNQSAAQNEIEGMRDKRGNRVFRKERNIDGTTTYVQKRTGNTVSFDNSFGNAPRERVAYSSGNYEMNKAATAAAMEDSLENKGNSFAENYARERNRIRQERQAEQWERDTYAGRTRAELAAIREKEAEAGKQRFFSNNFAALDAQLQKQNDATIKAQNVTQGKRIAAAQFLASAMLNGGTLAAGLCDDFSGLLGANVSGASFDKYGNFGFQYDNGDGSVGTQYVSRKAVRESIEGTFGSVGDFLKRYQGRIPDSIAHALLGDDIYEKNGEMARIGEQMDNQRVNWHRDRAAYNRGNAETERRIAGLDKQIQNNNERAEFLGKIPEGQSDDDESQDAMLYAMAQNPDFGKSIVAAREKYAADLAAVEKEYNDYKDFRLRLARSKDLNSGYETPEGLANALIVTRAKMQPLKQRIDELRSVIDGLGYEEGKIPNVAALTRARNDGLIDTSILRDSFMKYKDMVAGNRAEQLNGYDIENDRLEGEKSKLEGYRSEAQKSLAGNDASWLGGAMNTEAGRSDDVVKDARFAAMIEKPRNDLNREESVEYGRDAEKIAIAQDKFNKTPRPTTAEAQKAYDKQLADLRTMKDDFTKKWEDYASKKEEQAQEQLNRAEAEYQSALKEKDEARYDKAASAISTIYYHRYKDADEKAQAAYKQYYDMQEATAGMDMTDPNNAAKVKQLNSLGNAAKEAEQAASALHVKYIDFMEEHERKLRERIGSQSNDGLGTLPQTTDTDSAQQGNTQTPPASISAAPNEAENMPQAKREEVVKSKPVEQPASAATKKPAGNPRISGAQRYKNIKTRLSAPPSRKAYAAYGVRQDIDDSEDYKITDEDRKFVKLIDGLNDSIKVGYPRDIASSEKKLARLRKEKADIPDKIKAESDKMRNYAGANSGTLKIERRNAELALNKLESRRASIDREISDAEKELENNRAGLKKAKENYAKLMK